MKRISNTLFLPLFSLVSATSSYAAIISSSASLVDTSQNQAFESRPQAAAISKRPVSSSFIKLAAVHFITNDNTLNFGNQEFLPGDLCKQGGYTHEGCPTGYVKQEACPEDSRFYKRCIEADSWCKNNGYAITSCSVPKYPANPCPYKSSLYKSCETDNIRACKELGYSLTCEAGKVGGDSCPYNSSYKKCICNPCSGYGYTAAQASAQGYVPGEVCNSCGTIKYKRSENKCDGYQTCSEGGTSGASVCYSGTTKKFSECKRSCDSCPYTDTGGSCSGIYQYEYTGSTNCGESCYACCIKSGNNLYSTGCSCISDGNGGYTVYVGDYIETFTGDTINDRIDRSYTSYSFNSLSSCENSLSNLGHECDSGWKSSSYHLICQ